MVKLVDAIAEGKLFGSIYVTVQQVKNPRTVNTMDGERTVQPLTVTDGTANIDVEIWDPKVIFIAGQQLYLKGVWMKDYEGKKSLALKKDGGSVEITKQVDLPPAEAKVDPPQSTPKVNGNGNGIKDERDARIQANSDRRDELARDNNKLLADINQSLVGLTVVIKELVAALKKEGTSDAM